MFQIYAIFLLIAMSLVLSPQPTFEGICTLDTQVFRTERFNISQLELYTCLKCVTNRIESSPPPC